MISILFLDETAWEILLRVSPDGYSRRYLYILSSEGLVVHEEKVNFADVVDEESLVTGRHHVASLLVGSETNLYPSSAIVPLHAFVVDRGSRIRPLSSWATSHPKFLRSTPLVAHSFQSSNPVSRPPISYLRTDGITIWPLNRRRTLLSIPFGFLQLDLTHMNMSYIVLDPASVRFRLGKLADW